MFNSWYEMHPEHEYIPKTIVKIDCKCPVCQVFLGKRETGKFETCHCNECKASFTFFPGASKPHGVLDSEMKKTCGCPSCRAQRGEFDEEEEAPKKPYFPGRSDENEVDEG